jgi:hypothetical protein
MSNMKRLFNIIIVLAACALASCSASKNGTTSKNDWVRVTNGNLWLTAEGDTVQAHAPGFLRLGDTWYIAGQTNWDARDLTIDFSFLTEGKKYKAHLLTDGINAHHDAEDYRLSTMNCSSTTQQTIHLAPGGGFVIKLNSLP